VGGRLTVRPGATVEFDVVSSGETTLALENRGPPLLHMTLVDPEGKDADIGPTNFEPYNSLRQRLSRPQRIVLHNATQTACEVSYEATASGGLFVQIQNR